MEDHRLGDPVAGSRGGDGLRGWKPDGSQGKGKKGGEKKAGKLAQWQELDSRGWGSKRNGGRSRAKGAPVVLDCVVITFHHLLDDTKREAIVRWAAELQLGG
eukprot:COSAG01_NODE_1881_length_8990_cov_36.296142_5_plen_102_part_00